MAGVPHLNELKEMCGSDKLHDCFRFLMAQEIPLNEASLMWLGELRDMVRVSIEKRSERIVELMGLDSDEEEAAEDVYERLRQQQVMEKSLLESVSAILVQIRALIGKKEEMIDTMEEYD